MSKISFICIVVIDVVNTNTVSIELSIELHNVKTLAKFDKSTRKTGWSAVNKKIEQTYLINSASKQNSSCNIQRYASVRQFHWSGTTYNYIVQIKDIISTTCGAYRTKKMCVQVCPLLGNSAERSERIERRSASFVDMRTIRHNAENSPRPNGKGIDQKSASSTSSEIFARGWTTLLATRTYKLLLLEAVTPAIGDFHKLSELHFSEWLYAIELPEISWWRISESKFASFNEKKTRVRECGTLRWKCFASVVAVKCLLLHCSFFSSSSIIELKGMHCRSRTQSVEAVAIYCSALRRSTLPEKHFENSTAKFSNNKVRMTRRNLTAKFTIEIHLTNSNSSKISAENVTRRTCCTCQDNNLPLHETKTRKSGGAVTRTSGAETILSGLRAAYDAEIRRDWRVVARTGKTRRGGVQLAVSGCVQRVGGAITACGSR